MPNFVVQGGSPGANEYVGAADFMRDEVGLWPHVRGAVGISTRGRDTGDAQFFVDLVDDPVRPRYTVFGQLLNGIEVVRPDSRRGCDRAGRDHAVTFGRIGSHAEFSPSTG